MSSSQEVRFEFGENWSEFSKNINETEVQQAVDGLKKLLPENFDPTDKSFLDIGSGSGLHSVAAAKMGFTRIACTDYDPNSVATTKRNAEKFGVQSTIVALQDDILNSELNRAWVFLARVVPNILLLKSNAQAIADYP
ncbi:MAG: methyltransferase [Alphaproteobacteria bacterium]|nr:methyltransferase [Alphaproteobacteria bacterium]NCQ66809.1 methyltransferase [Alphaproteobacteria bacterium]NCT07377.1 methyltransferase [Alphaproteobacteria bacterium]